MEVIRVHQCKRCGKTWLARALLVLLLVLLSGLLSCSKAKKEPEVSLGFRHVKDVSSILDQDAFHEEIKLEKQLPDNQFVQAKRAMHEAALMNEFVDAFKNSEECNGITLYIRDDKKPSFVVTVGVDGHDEPNREQSWTWILGYPGDPGPANSPAHGIAGE